MHSRFAIQSRMWCHACAAGAFLSNHHSHCRLQAVLLYYWRRAARIAPAHWASLLLAYLTMLRGREQIPVPEATGALMHYPAAYCPGECC
jgi:peptidoglycan/LPS O-acetylase OafA/YrhL